MARRTSKRAATAEQIAERFRALYQIYSSSEGPRLNLGPVVMEAFHDVTGRFPKGARDEELLEAVRHLTGATNFHSNPRRADDSWEPVEPEVLVELDSGQTLLQVWRPTTGQHAYQDIETGLLLSDEEMQAAYRPNHRGRPFENPSEGKYWYAVEQAARGKQNVERYIPDLEVATWCLRWSHMISRSARVAPATTIEAFVLDLARFAMHEDVAAWKGGTRVQPPDGIPRPHVLTYEEYWQGVEMIAGYAMKTTGLEERGQKILRLVQAHPFTPFGRYAGMPEYTERAFDVIRHTGHLEAMDGFLFESDKPGAFDELHDEMQRTDTVIGICNVIAQAALIGDVWWRLGSPASRFSPNPCCDEIGG